jgi:WD40 repeat protein
VEVWNAASGELAKEFPLKGPGTMAKFAPGGTKVIVFDAGNLWCWDLRDDSRRRLGSIGETSATINFSDDGAWLAVGGAAHVWIWAIDSGNLIQELPYPPDVDMARQGPTLVFARFSPDKRFLVLHGFNRVVQLIETGTWKPARVFGPHPQHVSEAVIDSASTRLFTTSGPTVFAWNLSNGERLGELSGHTAAVAVMAQSVDGARLATAAVAPDFAIRLWDARTLEPILSLNGHRDQVHALQFTPDGRSLVSAAFDGTVRVWRTAMDQVPADMIDLAVRCRSNWRLDGGLLRETAPDAEACRSLSKVGR